MTPDSTRYVAVADSLGRFVIDHLPAGTFLVSGGVDANSNRTLDAREAFDSVRAPSTTTAPADSGGVELLAFVHDTVAPRIQTVTVRDSLTLRLTFDKPLAPGYALQPAAFEVVAADSSYSLPRRSSSSARPLSNQRRHGWPSPPLSPSPPSPPPSSGPRAVALERRRCRGRRDD